MVRLFLFLLLFSFSVWGTTASTTESGRTIGSDLEMGLTLQYLVPNRLPTFEVPVTGFGAHIGFPVLGQNIHLQGVYAGSEAISLLNLEAALRFNINNPFFTSCVYAGIHHLRYGHLNQNESFVGPMTGLGFYIPMAKNFLMGLGMKLYLPKKMMLSFGGSFSFLL